MRSSRSFAPGSTSAPSACATNEAAIGEWQRLQALLDGRTLDRADRAGGARGERGGGHVREAWRAGRCIGRPARSRRSPTGGRASAADGGEQRGRRAAWQPRRPSRGPARGRRGGRGGGGRAGRAASVSRRLPRRSTPRSACCVPPRSGSIAAWRRSSPPPSRAGCPASAAAPTTRSRSIRPTCRSASRKSATGKWREARLLSEGTREQIYLLLRVAMAEHLVTTGETAPLLLDEVTVQSDPRAQAAAARRCCTP